MTIKENIRKFIVDRFLFGDESLFGNDTDSFLDKRMIDSTGVMELVSFIESTYKIQIKDEEIIPENLDSLNNIESFIKNKAGA